jgi:hypothetical protein
MIILGYKANANFDEAGRAIVKHTSMDKQRVKKVIADIRDGKGVTLPDDFVLREDLIDLNFIVN